MTVAEISAAAPNFDLAAYFAGNGSPKFSTLNVGNPDFFKQVNSQLDSVPLADWKTYLRWKTINSHAQLLTKAFVEEDFLFNGKYMSGQQEMEPRWKRCVKSDRPEPWHGARPALRGQDIWRRRQRAHSEDGEGHRRRHAAGHRPTDLDVRHHQEAGLREAEHHREQHRLSRSVARLQQRGHHLRRLCRQLGARGLFRSQAASTTRSTSPPTAKTGA